MILEKKNITNDYSTHFYFRIFFFFKNDKNITTTKIILNFNLGLNNKQFLIKVCLESITTY